MDKVVAVQCIGFKKAYSIQVFVILHSVVMLLYQI